MATTPNNPQPTVDYDALAKQFGATESAPDYDSLAKQFGATDSAPATNQKEPAPSGAVMGLNFINPSDIGQGLSQAGQDVWGVVKHVVQHPIETGVNIATSGGVVGSIKDLHESVKEAVPVIQAYEDARSQGRGVWDSLSAASEQAKKQQEAQNILKQRAEDFKKNPTQATTRALGDAAAAAAAMWAGNAAMGAILPEAGATVADAATESAALPEAEAVATAAPKPGIIKQVLQGEKVAQTPAQQALRSGAQASATDAGVADAAATSTGGVRTLLDEPIEALSKTERAAYDTINEASETDLKSLYDRASELQDALDDPTNIAQKSALQKELQTTHAAIQDGEELATSKGVSPETLNKAKGMTQQRYAMENLNQKLFNNEGVVSGNAEHGVEETINIKSAIRQVENLDKPSKFAPRGTPSRLQQALGEDGAKALKRNLYQAQKAGQVAATRQQWAKWIAYGAAGTLGLGRVAHIAGALIP